MTIWGIAGEVRWKKWIEEEWLTLTVEERKKIEDNITRNYIAGVRFDREVIGPELNSKQKAAALERMEELRSKYGHFSRGTGER